MPGRALQLVAALLLSCAAASATASDHDETVQPVAADRADYDRFAREAAALSLSDTSHAPRLADRPILDTNWDYVDRAELANVLREQRALELVRLWRSDTARLYIGVGPNGLAGINFTSLRPKQRPRNDRTIDYAKIIDTLVARSEQANAH